MNKDELTLEDIDNCLKLLQNTNDSTPSRSMLIKAFVDLRAHRLESRHSGQGVEGEEKIKQALNFIESDLAMIHVGAKDFNIEMALESLRSVLSDDVKITIDGKERMLSAGEYSTKSFLRMLTIKDKYKLSQIINGNIIDLSNETHFVINGGELFVTNYKTIEQQLKDFGEPPLPPSTEKSEKEKYL